jgi:CRP/FNR family cyclic AMP-dependent transcriptional regulator
MNPPFAVIAERNGIDSSRLRRFDLFAPLSKLELAEIACCARELHVASGTLIIRQGQVGDDVYMLEDGLIDVYREKRGEVQMLALIDSRTVFGEMALVNQERIRTANVKALTELKLLAVSVEDMRGFLRRFPMLNQELRSILTQRGFAN